MNRADAAANGFALLQNQAGLKSAQAVCRARTTTDRDAQGQQMSADANVAQATAQRIRHGSYWSGPTDPFSGERMDHEFVGAGG